MTVSAKAVLSSALAAVGAFLFGLDIGYIAPILNSASFRRDVAGIEDPSQLMSDATQGFVVGIFSLGCVVSSLPCISGHFMDTLGRRDTIILGAGIFLVGCVVQAATRHVGTLLVGRLVSGLSIGLLSPVVSLYQSEVAPPEFRGSLTTFYQLMITFGIVVACVVDRYLVDCDGGWRWAILLQVLPASLLVFGMPLMPRSPRWLAQRGRTEEALRALRSFRDDDEQARRELDAIVQSLEEASKQTDLGWKDLRSGLVGRLVLVGVALQLLQQFVGLNAFMYFGPRIFEKLGSDPNKLQVYMSVLNFVATLPAIYLSDACGRRFLMVVGGFFCAVACFVMGVAGPAATDSTLGRMTIVGMTALFVASFAVGWGPIVWTYCSEIFPQRQRSKCMALATTANWIGNYAIAQATPVLFGRYGFGMFYIFGGFCIIATCAGMWLPETKGVPLENMSAMFEQHFAGTLGPNARLFSQSPKLSSYGSARA
mmetsp:Transcript_112436/g.323212  ORF Transcript_112436/g.323212 Transcript_112436/m.323212 type:complete len:483 (-) Transcript_112436:57-1505(-)|eukprot:CAMPEP_0170236836 /NCGR_PEP_ID=MMETSP0116_2-20130129/18167_1 /TAXON_ID=400756 /ORGANISM="Durinskia baltica, Strain CSIRO CS-38" /LENGTH=482 /DNA_ID=CAMNT_0010487637 /DNA_START=115 /DNA_END=1563 /DNA_ORIENTATION=-